MTRTTSSEMQVCLWHNSRGIQTALVSEGRKRLTAIVIEARGIKAVALDKREQRYMTELEHAPAKARKIYRAAGRRLGITKQARRLLREPRT